MDEKRESGWYEAMKKKIVLLLVEEKCTVSEAKEVLAITARTIEHSPVAQISDC